MSEQIRHTAPFTDRDRRNGDIRHGTPSGAARHSALGEDPCDACRAAKTAYDQEWRSAPDKTKRNRLHARAQWRALQVLSKAHPDEYRRYYLAFKEQLIGEVAARD